MIVAETSALAAILFDEPEAERFLATLFASRRTVIGAPTAFELRVVVTRRKGAAFVHIVDTLLARSQIEIIAWDGDHLLLANEALRRYGGRPAKLNYGDCMAYAVARSLDAPLLYKGKDFAHTDIRSALA